MIRQLVVLSSVRHSDLEDFVDQVGIPAPLSDLEVADVRCFCFRASGR